MRVDQRISFSQDHDSVFAMIFNTELCLHAGTIVLQIPEHCGHLCRNVCQETYLTTQ